MRAHVDHPQVPREHTSIVANRLDYDAELTAPDVIMRGRIIEGIFRNINVESGDDLSKYIEKIIDDNFGLSGYTHLNDPLADLISYPKINHRLILEKSTEEFRAARSWISSDGMAPSELLLRIRRKLGLHAAYRHTSVWIIRDKKGNNVKFPDHKHVPQLLRDMDDAFFRLHLRAPALAAIAAYVGIIHAHPFADGNGRSSRIVLNTLLGEGKPGAFTCYSMALPVRASRANQNPETRRA